MPEDSVKANTTHIFKKDTKDDPENCRLVSLILFPGKVMEQLIPEIISRHMKDNKVIRSSQHGFTMACLTNFITIYNEITGLVDEGKAVDIVYLDFSQAFDTASCKILIGKLVKYGLHERTVK